MDILRNTSTNPVSYEEFCKECEKRPNVVFLSSDELELFCEAIRLMRILNKENYR